MTDSTHISHWGQSTLRFAFPGATILTDPYLSDRVAELEGNHLRRMRPAPVAPEAVTNVDWALISHDHLDHYDPATVLPLLEANPNARLIAPSPVVDAARADGVAADRVQAAEEAWVDLAPGVRVHAVPAAHPTVDRDDRGVPRQVGFVIEGAGRRYYFAGDTSVHEELIDAVRALAPIHVAFLPINEKNFFRDRAGIIGNMTVREAFQLGEELEVDALVPIHHDMFAPNCVYPEEIQLLDDRLKPSFQLVMNPEAL